MTLCEMDKAVNWRNKYDLYCISRKTSLGKRIFFISLRYNLLDLFQHTVRLKITLFRALYYISIIPKRYFASIKTLREWYAHCAWTKYL